ncbi:unnamed protein product [Vicia faba]|uniref:Uncharacterized protein n=1 Tax=Vicia faba TaxID=3906 RepID=A0AAV0ZMJ1_VICFA|nr:unnamed protein product [Vicia faba]
MQILILGLQNPKLPHAIQYDQYIERNKDEPPSSTAFPLQTFASYGSHYDEKHVTNFKHKVSNKENLKDHKYSNLERIESKLAKARYSIKEASKVQNSTSIHQDQEYVPHGPSYRNAYACF